MSDRVLLDHGASGKRAADLIWSVFRSRFADAALDEEGDSAIVTAPSGRIAVTTDAHVVKPIFFPGGDIGRLSICGTVNDLAVAGATPAYITASVIIEEGFLVDDLNRIAESMAATAREAGVRIVAGDTKVVARGECDGVFISTAGVGMVAEEHALIAGGTEISDGDVVVVSGYVGDHGASIVCARNDIASDPPITSDCAPLGNLTMRILESADVHFMRDATRGGVATVLCEIATARHLAIEIHEDSVPVRPAVESLCEMYGFDPLYLANEGTLIAVVSSATADSAVAALRANQHGRYAATVGAVSSGGTAGRVTLQTVIGGSRVLRRLTGDQLPRIC